jgi:hypothetical protein
MNERDRHLGAVSVSFIRAEHYIQGIGEKATTSTT